MGFTMNFSKEQIAGKPPVPDGQYDVLLSGFKPGWSRQKPGQSVDDWKQNRSLNLNPQLEVTGNADHDQRKVFENLNMSAAWILNDFLHCFGQKMEEVQDGNQGTEAASFSFPGIFDGSEQFPEEPEKWTYLGPLTNQVGRVELTTQDFNGKKSNKVRQWICRVPGCTDKHSTNLIK